MSIKKLNEEEWKELQELVKKKDEQEKLLGTNLCIAELFIDNNKNFFL